jgi:hypothetical protein
MIHPNMAYTYEHHILIHVRMDISSQHAPCSLGLLATSQQYFSLGTNQPPATSQQYSSLRTNQHQPSATSQPNRPMIWSKKGIGLIK